MTSCRLHNYSFTVTLRGGPVVLRLVRATPCLTHSVKCKYYTTYVYKAHSMAHSLHTGVHCPLSASDQKWADISIYLSSVNVSVDDSGGPRETPVAYSGPLRANTVLYSFNTIQPSSCIYLSSVSGRRYRRVRLGSTLRGRSSRYDALSNTRHVPTNLLAGTRCRLL